MVRLVWLVAGFAFLCNGGVVFFLGSLEGILITFAAVHGDPILLFHLWQTLFCIVLGSTVVLLTS